MTKKQKIYALVAAIIGLAVILVGLNLRSAIRYNIAQNLLSSGRFEQAGDAFAALGGYEESSRLSVYSRACAAAEKGDFDAASKGFSMLGDYKDCKLLTSYYAARQEEANGEYYTSSYLYAIEAYNKMPMFRDAEKHIETCRRKAYDAAVRDGEQGNYQSAIKILDKLKPYQDSAKYTLYFNACNSLDKGYYTDALKGFAGLGKFKDSEKKLTQVKEKAYQQAELYLQKRDYTNAYNLFELLGDYSDAKERILASKYERAEACMAAYDFTGAEKLYGELGDYSDATEKLKSITAARQKKQAEDYKNMGQYQMARELYLSLQDQENANECGYLYAVSVENTAPWEAWKQFTALGGYKDSADRAKKLYPVRYERIEEADGNGLRVFLDPASGWGLLDKNADIAVEPVYTGIRYAQNGNYMVLRSGKAGVIKPDGSALVDLTWDGISMAGSGYMVNLNGYYGLLDADGKVLVPAEYSEITKTVKGYRVVRDGKQGLLKADGSTLVSPQYDGIEQMADGRLLVTVGYLNGILDADGKTVIEPAYHKIVLENTGNYTVTRDNKYGIVSYEGKVLREADMEWIGTGSNDGKYLMFRQDGLYGFMKADTFEVVVPAEWKKANIMYNGYAYIQNNLDKWGVIDGTGKVTVTPQWDKISWYEDCGHALWGKKLMNNKGQPVCDFSEYNKNRYMDVKYHGNGVFADGNENKCLYDVKAGKKYSFKVDNYNVTDLKMYSNGLLSGKIPYKTSSGRNYAYGMIDPATGNILSDTQWKEIYAVPGKAVKDSRYGWIGKDGKDLLKPVYDYIRGETVNGKIIAAKYNDRGNLVYELIDDTTGKTIQSGITSEEEALTLCQAETAGT